MEASAMMMGAEDELLLSISIVVFEPDFVELNKTLASLSVALERLPSSSFSVIVVDNSAAAESVDRLIQAHAPLPIRVISGQGNIGFGRGHNLALAYAGEYHLILNPDVVMDSDALANALEFMKNTPQCGLISPCAIWPTGERQYLCKRFPAVFDLLLRGFAPRFIRSMFASRMRRYEMQSETRESTYRNPPIVSGCFMLFRGAILRQVGGFNEQFFLYFEDFDLSLRTGAVSEIFYVPTVRIVHAGGQAAKKGFAHVRMFAESAKKFYSIHGLKLF